MTVDDMREETPPARDRSAIGYCGLACGLCVHACEPDCRSGGGFEGCVQRACCTENGLDGCWECASLPCDKGTFAEDGDTAFRGVCIGSVLCIQECGTAAYLDRVAERLGDPVEYGDCRYLDPGAVRSMLCE